MSDSDYIIANIIDSINCANISFNRQYMNFKGLSHFSTPFHFLLQQCVTIKNNFDYFSAIILGINNQMLIIFFFVIL